MILPIQMKPLKRLVQVQSVEWASPRLTFLDYSTTSETAEIA